VGARLGRGAYRGHPGRAPRGRGDYHAASGGLGREAREYLGDAATTYGGDALPPCPGAVGHSPKEPAEAEPRIASLDGAARDLCWVRKHSLPEPSHPDHWDLNTAEEEIHRVFTKTYGALHAMWVVPCIAGPSYPRAV
jgi:hypothetical protein